MAKKEMNYETPSDDQLARLNQAKETALDGLLGIPGVHTVGVGYKRCDGRVTDELSVIVYVDHKVPREEVKPEWLIAPEIRFFNPDGGEEVVSTDVVERPRAVEYPHLADGSLAGKVRPVPGGRSIEGGLGGGTLGGWVWDDINDQVVLLSNRHVLGTAVGANVYQPWGSTVPPDKIADNVRTGTMDATIAAPTDSAHVTYEIEGVGSAVYETTVAVLNMPVEKSGATTEHTTGKVVAVNLTKNHIGSTNDFEVDPDPGQLRFAYYGDSGSLIVERTHPEGAKGWKRVVGLLWGGDPSEGTAYGHQIEDVFEDLDLMNICAGIIAWWTDALFAPSFAMIPAAREFAHAAAEKRLQPELTTPPGWRKRQSAGRHRGLAREVEERIKQTKRGQKLAELIQSNRVGVVRLATDPGSRRVLEAAAAPFINGLWSANEIVEQRVTDEDVARFNRALVDAAERLPDLEELVAELRSLLDKVSGRSFGEVMR